MSDIEEKRAELRQLVVEIEADLRSRVIGPINVSKAKDDRRLQLERELAAWAGEPYAEVLAIDLVIGNEWHVVSNGTRETVVLCGGANRPPSSLFRFDYTEEFRVTIPPLGAPSGIAGLGIYGLFRVRNSEWIRATLAARRDELLHFDEAWWSRFEHFVLRSDGGELACLARGYDCRSVPEEIMSIREKARFWCAL